VPYDVDWIVPDWPAPAQIRACTTTRAGGASNPPFDSFNLADHVGDDPAAVAVNRARLVDVLGLPNQPCWLRQVHGIGLVDAGRQPAEPVPEGDGAYSDQAGVVCAVLTADCLPVLLCDRSGRRVAAVHAGWRGLSSGILERAIDVFGGSSDGILAWLGPAIGPDAFEVGDEVRETFVKHDSYARDAFLPSRPGHWMADLYLLARQRLAGRGVANIYGGGLCTFSDESRFYSYRRDGTTGRMASLIWRDS
jgi:YfiH family protein